MPETTPTSTPTTGPVIGIDLGGTNLQVGVVQPDNAVVGRVKRKTKASQGVDAVIARLADSARASLAAAGLDIVDISALGIVAPGAIDIPKGVVIEAPNLEWENVPLRDRLAKELGVAVTLDNDVNGAVWGEYHLGAGRGKGSALGVWVGTGVGGGLVIDGALYHGDRFTAGEIGQTVVCPDGPDHETRLEDVASRTGMSRIIQRRLPACPDSVLHDLTDSTGRVTGSSKLALAVTEGDGLAIEVVSRAAHLLGVAIANQITMLSLDNVIVGGGVTEALGASFIDSIRASFEMHVFPASARNCKIVMTKLEADAGVLGAALLAREALGVAAS